MPVEETNAAFDITPVKAFNKTQVIAALRATVDEFGEDYLYKAPVGDHCVYTHHNDEGEECPSCLVGQVLFRLDIPIAAIADLDGAWFEVEDDLASQGYRFTTEASRALTAAQKIQDRAVDDPGAGDATWGAALRVAEETL